LLEQLRPRLEYHARPVVHHVQFYNTARALERDADHDAGGAAAAMPQRVAAQVPHHLVEMAAIGQDVRVRGQLDAKHAGVDLLDLGELLDEAGQKIGQPEALTMRALAAVQPQHIVHHAIEAPAVFVDDGDEPRRGIAHPRLLAQQLRGVADRPERVPDLVGDVGREPPQRGELQLARLRLNARLVLDEDHGAQLAVPADRHEARALAAAVGHAGSGVHPRAAAPLLVLRGEGRRVLRQRHLAACRQRPEEALGARVELADNATPVHHQHAILHVADHELVHLLQVGEVDLPLRREPLARHGVLGERVREPRDREIRAGQQPGLNVLGVGGFELERLVGMLEQHADAGERGEEEREPPAADQARAG